MIQHSRHEEYNGKQNTYNICPHYNIDRENQREIKPLEKLSLEYKATGDVALKF